MTCLKFWFYKTLYICSLRTTTNTSTHTNILFKNVSLRVMFCLYCKGVFILHPLSINSFGEEKVGTFECVEE